MIDYCEKKLVGRISESISALHNIARRCAIHLFLSAAIISIGITTSQTALAAVPIDYLPAAQHNGRYAGHINIVAAGGTLRSGNNDTAPCALNTSGSMTLSGIPTGSTIVAAWLYWAGSGSAVDGTINFNGYNNITADRTFTDTAPNDNTLHFFGGFKDVTTGYGVTGNGNYSFSGLAVDASNTYCDNQTVLSGFAMVVIYENPSEDLRLINSYDGFQIFQNNSITLDPSGFKVPASPINGKHLVISWEGDETLTGTTENITFAGQALPRPTDPLAALNPANNQFNSVSSANSPGPTTTYGVDVDLYNITSVLSSGMTTGTAVYSAGQDLVILTHQSISVTNTPMCDLAINKSASGSFTVGTEGVYTISVTNAADSNDPATGITVTDQLPNELIYVSAEGNGWTCGYNTSNRTVTCTRPGPLAAGAAAPDITLKVIVGDALSVTNTATVTVSSDMLDIYTANNSKSVTTPVSGSTPPSSGNKPLYLYDSSTLKLSRTPMGISTNYVTIAKGGNTASWNLSPVLPSAVTINSGTQNIQGHLRLSTNNNGTYSIPITLRCGTTPVASVTMSCDLNGTVKDCPFNLPPTTYTCPKDSYWGLDVTNNRNVFLFAADVRVWPTPSANNYSYVNLPSKSVISVDSIGIYNNSYLNGGSVVTSVSPGNTVYIRAMVSDPFGAYDINGAIDGVTVTLTPPPPGTSVKYNMVPTSYSTSASKLYEYGPYTVPTGGGSLGDWNVAVEAKEGTEGTVKDTSSAKMPVVIANLTIMKTADKPTGKVNSGVGEIITYTITVTNNGTGPASNAIVTDPVPTYTTYVANSTRMNGGPPPSITVAGDGATSPLIAGLLVDDNTSRGAGVAATGILPAGKSATITFKVTVN